LNRPVSYDDGFSLEALYGGFAREPLTNESREYVFVTRKPDL
jgi:hypothetical protein